MDAMTLMLLVAHFLALGVAIMVFGWMIFLQRRNRTAELLYNSAGEISPGQTAAIRPSTWLTIYSADPQTIRALLPEKNGFFISPRNDGWVIVSGPGLPDPGDDVDACHLFLTTLSRELGLVQFFHAEIFSAHHAWARLDTGCVIRAYAWADKTIWNQGTKTMMEESLGLNCPGYGEGFSAGFWAAKENALANVKKIPLLAAHWSLDPKILHRADGITGESPRL
jgi:hypothetical protein